MNCFIRLILSVFFFITTMDVYASNDGEISLEEIIIAADLYQDDWKIAEIDQRIYVKSSAVILEDNKIYLLIGPFQVQIPSLHCDSTGTYMCAEGWLAWQCCKCKFNNSKRVNCCQNCHNQRC